MSRILDVKNLGVELALQSKRIKVVDNVHFQLDSGQTLAIVGESGCGKSMTALALLKLLPTPPALPPQGEVLFCGKDLIPMSEKEMRQIRGKDISMIFQDPASALNPVYTLGEQLMEVIRVHTNLSESDGVERVLSVLSEVHIPAPEKRFHEYPHQLSGGMRQRVMIAMAILLEPKLIVADEPTTALDVTIQAEILDLLRELQARNGMALVLITHDMGVVAEMADQVLVMYASRVVESGPVDTIFDELSHPYTRGLFQSLPHLAEGGELKSIAGMVPSITDLPSGCNFHPRCPHAMEKCKKGSIPTLPVSQDHLVRCVLFDKESCL